MEADGDLSHEDMAGEPDDSFNPLDDPEERQVLYNAINSFQYVRVLVHTITYS